MKRWSIVAVGVLMVIAVIAILASAPSAETISWVNPTMYADNTAITPTDQARITNYLRYKTATMTTPTYFGETRGGKSSWTGTLPVAEGVSATYTVSAAITGLDNVERDSAPSAGVTYTRPFPVRVPGVPSQVQVSP